MKKIWKDPVWGGLIVAGLSSLYIFVFGDWANVFAAVKAGWAYLTSTVGVPLWAVVLASLWIIGTTFTLIAIRFSTVNEVAANDWSSYRTDKFLGLRWRWKLHGGNPDSLTAFCTACDYQLDPVRESPFDVIDSVRLHCDQCGVTSRRFNESFHSLEHRVAKLIQQKLRNGTWREPNA